MSWVSSTFGNVIGSSFKENKRNKTTLKRAKKFCSNPWVEEYPPLSSEEVAIHKKKLQDVQNWLTEVVNPPNRKRILLLTGPPGSSKSAVIRTLAKEMNFSLREWTNSFLSSKDNYNKNDVASFYRYHEIEFSMNQSDKFTEFIFKASKYKDLCVNKNVCSSLILVEEIPNVFLMRPTEFHEILKKYNANCPSPIVFIVSEGNNNNIVKSLFPVEVQEELFVTNITFNPVSSSLLQNALNRILTLTESTTSTFFDSVGTTKKQFVQMVSEKSGGDVRSAINTLQFMMMKDKSDTRKSKSAKGVKTKSALSDEDFIGCKDSPLILFRALGKVLYCKREKSERVPNVKPLPPHLRVHERENLIEDPDDIFQRSGSTYSTFSLFLHQNSLSFFSDIDDFSSAINYLSDADILDRTWDPSQVLEAYSSTVSIRGMMHSLKIAERGGAPQTFRSFTKPSWYNYVNTSKVRIRRIKFLNKYLPLGTEELVCQYVPLMAKIYYGSNAEADRFIREVGLLYPPPANNSSMKPIQLATEDTLGLTPEEGDDEFFIEEIED